jgi:hypothetical protein
VKDVAIAFTLTVALTGVNPGTTVDFGPWARAPARRPWGSIRVAFAARDGYDHCRQFTCEERHIKDVVPAMTMVGGEIVFARDDGDGGKAT